MLRCGENVERMAEYRRVWVKMLCQKDDRAGAQLTMSVPNCSAELVPNVSLPALRGRRMRCVRGDPDVPLDPCDIAFRSL